MRLFQITALHEDQAYRLNTQEDFVNTFSQATIFERDLLCELYLDDMAMPHLN